MGAAEQVQEESSALLCERGRLLQKIHLYHLVAVTFYLICFSILI